MTVTRDGYVAGGGLSRHQGVQIANVRGKTKRFGQMEGKRADWKKAYVRLREGEKPIESHAIEASGGLIEKQDRTRGAQRAGQRDPATFPPRQTERRPLSGSRR